MSRVPPAANCTGGGRSTFVCHAGTMERRRGDSYLGKDFSEPAGLPEDVHVAKKLVCVDCHETGPGGMGHIERKATCQDCHIEVEQAMATSVHKNLACAACHVKVLGGYEMTSWGPGMIASKPNPFKKYSLYYGPQETADIAQGPARHAGCRRRSGRTAPEASRKPSRRSRGSPSAGPRARPGMPTSSWGRSASRAGATTILPGSRSRRLRTRSASHAPAAAATIQRSRPQT